jgi:hypothetical protein
MSAIGKCFGRNAGRKDGEKRYGRQGGDGLSWVNSLKMPNTIAACSASQKSWLGL